MEALRTPQARRWLDALLAGVAVTAAGLALVRGVRAEDSASLSTPSLLWLALVLLALLRGWAASPANTVQGIGRISQRWLGLAFALFVVLLVPLYMAVLDAFPFDTDDWNWLIGVNGILRLEPHGWVMHGGTSLFRSGGVGLHLLVQALFGMNPSAIRVTALLLHAGNGVLLLSLAQRLGLSGRWCLAAAALFLLFTPNHEVISTLAVADFALTGTLVLGALLLLERSVEPDRPRAHLQLVAGLAVYLAALATKELAVVFPVLLAAWAVAVEPGAIGQALWRRRVPLLATLTLAAIAAAVMLTTPVATAVDAAGQLIDQRVGLVDALSLAGLWQAFVDVLPRALAVPFSPAVVPLVSSLLAGLLLAGMAALIVVCGLAGSPVPARALGLAVFSAAAFAPVFFLAEPHHDYLEGTRYFYLPSIGWALLLATALAPNADSGRLGRRLRTAALLLLLAVYLAPLPMVHGVRWWVGRSLQHTSGVLGEELRRRDEGHELFLACSEESVDRGGMEAALMAQLVRGPVQPRVHLLTRLHLVERVRRGYPMTRDANRLSIVPGPRVALLGWPSRASGRFGPLDADALWALIATREAAGRRACVICRRILVTFGDDLWVLEGDVFSDVTLRSIVERS